MSTMSVSAEATDFATNPFFKYDMKELCAICHKRLEKANTHSIFATVPKLEPSMNAFEILKSFSNFNDENGPQHLCTTCFHNTTAAYKFKLICNRAHEHIQCYLRHQEEMRTKMQEEMTNEEDDTKEETISDSDQYGEVDELKSEIGEESSKTKAKRSKCKVCHKMYRHDYLAVHMRTHTGERPYQCKICNKTFAQPTTLKLHEASHSEYRSFICNYCGKAFKLYRTLKKHEMTHTGERPYKCKMCDKAFADSSTLKQHYLVHTKEKRFQCSVCAKTFGRNTYLTQHLVSHATVKKHECHLCGNRFTQAHSLRTHLKMSCQARKYDVQDVCTETLVVVNSILD